MQFLVTITHSQISIFDNAEPDFNLWSDDHVAQGFSWRLGHVSFGVPDHDGQCVVEVKKSEQLPELSDDVLRAIRVPFSAMSEAFVATIIDESKLDIPVGDYALEYQLRPGQPDHDQYPHTFLISFFFVPGFSEDFKILRRHEEMTATEVITMSAEPAR